jgi:hypothetical protein
VGLYKESNRFGCEESVLFGNNEAVFNGDKTPFLDGWTKRK